MSNAGSNEPLTGLWNVDNVEVKCNNFSAASRTVNHYIGKDPEAAPMNLPMIPKISKELSARLGGTPPAEGLFISSFQKSYCLYVQGT